MSNIGHPAHIDELLARIEELEEHDAQRTVILAGSPFDGYTIIGPFADDERAQNYAEAKLRGVDWWLAYLAEPNNATAQEMA
jgi:hypothetical protein